MFNYDGAHALIRKARSSTIRNSINSRELLEACLAAVWGPARQKGASVLMYHRFHPSEPAKWTVTTAVFERQLQWLLAHHYRFERLRAVVSSHLGSSTIPLQHTVALSVDDGDRSIYTEMYPLIRRYCVPVTLFIYPSTISVTPGFLSWEELDEMIRSGYVDVQSHSLTHPSFREERARRSPADFLTFLDCELSQSRTWLAGQLGTKIDLLAWPHGVHDAEMEEVAARTGYVAAFGVKQRSKPAANRFAIPRVHVADRHQANRLGVRLAMAEQLHMHCYADGARLR